MAEWRSPPHCSAAAAAAGRLTPAAAGGGRCLTSAAVGGAAPLRLLHPWGFYSRRTGSRPCARRPDIRFRSWKRSRLYVHCAFQQRPRFVENAMD